MLEITIGAKELFNEDTEEFSYTKPYKLVLEHSLVSLSKWEMKYQKPFLSQVEKLPREELLDYFRFMTITQNIPDEAYEYISKQEENQILSYINNPMTATWFSKSEQKPSREVVTSELIYYWMIVNNIDWKAEKWHLNRLMTLIRVCSIKNSSGQKMNKRDIMKENAKLNAARRKASGSHG